MKNYTIETLKQINLGYDYDHRVTESDVEKANQWVKFIESRRTEESPQIGDIVEFTDKHGDYYKNAHIEKVEGDTLNICEQPYIPFVGIYNNKLYTSTSGGAWTNIPQNLKLIGKRSKLFKDWGHCGACGNGAINFECMVNVWEYAEPDQFHQGYSTKNHNKFYVTVLEKEEDREKHNYYKYLVTTSGCTSHTAFKTDKEYQAWLKTFNGVEFNGHWQNQRIVWTHKQYSKCIPLEEYNRIENAVIDSELCNGTIQQCKRIYEDNTVKTFLPYQHEKIPMEEIKVEHIRAYAIL